MKRYDAILFDLDGTLLPMVYENFMKAYFKELCIALAPLGLDPKKTVDAIWVGCGAMVKNDGSKLNREVFWETFEKVMGGDIPEIKKICDGFYTDGFHRARRSTEENPLAKRAVEAAHCAADKVVLATNPLFPRDGQLTRIGWVGLNKDDFDLITSYDSDSFCKPNPQYYLSICQRMGVDPQRCLMIGNDEREDAFAASQAGLDTYLITDCLIANEKYPCDCRRGTFEEMCDYLEGLAK